jgi:hypothetical protein
MNAVALIRHYQEAALRNPTKHSQQKIIKTAAHSDIAAAEAGPAPPAKK